MFSYLFIISLLVVLFEFSSQSKCPCPSQTSCEIVSGAQAIIKAEILFETNSTNSISYTCLVKDSFKGSFNKLQQIMVQADSQCVSLKSGHNYVLSLTLQGTEWWIDSCGVHSLQQKLSSDLWQSISNFSQWCMGECVDQSGVVWGNGETWNPTACNTCKCSNGVTTCTPMTCVPAPCANSYVPTGECCPICPQVNQQCLYQGSAYLNGQSWYPSQCELCQCSNGAVTCLAVTCRTDICIDSEGHEHYNGELFDPNDCQNCQCYNGNISCITEVCLTPTCANPTIVSGTCCPSCPSS